MMLCALLLVLMVFLRFGPDIPFRRMLHRQLVESPVKVMLSRKRQDYIFLGVAGALFLLGGEFLVILGPEFALAYAADVALYLDIMVVGALTSALARIRSALAACQHKALAAVRFVRDLARGPRRARRSRKAVRRVTPANDDEGDPAVLRVA